MRSSDKYVEVAAGFVETGMILGITVVIIGFETLGTPHPCIELQVFPVTGPPFLFSVVCHRRQYMLQ
jgi:hypothetical protein